MTPTVHLVLGMTGLGKTRLAVALAALEEFGPVIALDRFQGHPEIAIGSGRPTTEQLRGTTRLYLADGPLAAGPIEPVAAIDRLVLVLRSLLEDGARQVVVEGGSISLLQELLSRPSWCAGWNLHARVCVESSPGQYEERIAAWVDRMLGYPPGEPRSLLHELADLWDDPLARKHVADVRGYAQAIDLCDIHGLTPQDLTGQAGQLWRFDLAKTIRAAHLGYARHQRRALAAALPRLNNIAKEVELCET